MSTRPEAVTAALLRGWPLPGAGGSKHSRGHVVVIGGSQSTPGALALAGVAALRVGAGVLALAAPDTVSVALAVSVPESSVRGFAEEAGWNDRLTDLVRAADGILVGPGLDDPDVTTAVMRGLATAEPGSTPILLDAFALGALAADPGLRPESDALVLSPNTSEAARLLDVAEDDVGEDPVPVAEAIARGLSAVVTYNCVIASPELRTWQVPTGHAGLGTSGSGDVLAGAIVGLLARGCEPAQAAVWATYLHATAGDRLAPRVGRLGFLARELLDELPAILTEVEAA